MKDKKSCPSAPFKKGNSVFGIFKDNQFNVLDEPIKIHSGNIHDQFEVSNPSDLRVTMPCVSKGCTNWSNGKCHVPDQMRYFFQPISDAKNFSDCPIQSSCRWYAQDKEEACKICPLLRTENLELQL